MDKYRKNDEKIERFEISAGKIIALERIIEGFFDKYPNRRLPHSWVEALENRYSVSHDDVLNTSRRVRKRLGLKIRQ